MMIDSNMFVLRIVVGLDFDVVDSVAVGFNVSSGVVVVDIKTDVGEAVVEVIVVDLVNVEEGGVLIVVVVGRAVFAVVVEIVFVFVEDGNVIAFVDLVV